MVQLETSRTSQAAGTDESTTVDSDAKSWLKTKATSAVHQLFNNEADVLLTGNGKLVIEDIRTTQTAQAPPGSRPHLGAWKSFERQVNAALHLPDTKYLLGTKYLSAYANLTWKENSAMEKYVQDVDQWLLIAFLSIAFVGVSYMAYIENNFKNAE